MREDEEKNQRMAQETLKRIPQRGSSPGNRKEEEALADLAANSAGMSAVLEAQWGEIPRARFFLEKQRFFGTLEYRASGFGGALMLDSDAQRWVGSVDMKEISRCVSLHLSDAPLWRTRGRKRVVPKGGTFHHTMNTRKADIMIATHGMEKIQTATTFPDHPICSHAHDTLVFGHGRAFRGAPFFLFVGGEVPNRRWFGPEFSISG